MAYFADMTPYSYYQADEEQVGTVNIGWLELGKPFTTGETSEVFRAKLLRLCARRMNETLGFHACDFCCGRDQPPRIAEEPVFGIGSAEIRIPGAGKVYAAPELVCHYIVAHSYLPPEEFIEAVLACDEADA